MTSMRRAMKIKSEWRVAVPRKMADIPQHCDFSARDFFALSIPTRSKRRDRSALFMEPRITPMARVTNGSSYR
ncbi:MAG: hypothetical protein ACKV0T_12340 [Planctomycetales bacterium]